MTPPPTSPGSDDPRPASRREGRLSKKAFQRVPGKSGPGTMGGIRGGLIAVLALTLAAAPLAAPTAAVVPDAPREVPTGPADDEPSESTFEFGVRFVSELCMHGQVRYGPADECSKKARSTVCLQSRTKVADREAERCPLQNEIFAAAWGSAVAGQRGAGGHLHAIKESTAEDTSCNVSGTDRPTCQLPSESLVLEHTLIVDPSQRRAGADNGLAYVEPEPLPGLPDGVVVAEYRSQDGLQVLGHPSVTAGSGAAPPVVLRLGTDRTRGAAQVAGYVVGAEYDPERTTCQTPHVTRCVEPILEQIDGGVRPVGSAPDPGAAERSTGARSVDTPAPSALATSTSASPTTDQDFTTVSDRLGGAAPEMLDAPAIGVAVAALVTAGLAAVALYRRLSKDDILEHELRRRILDVVSDEPGVNASGLADRLDVCITTVLYHARVLAEADHLVVKRQGGEVRLVDPEAGCPATRETLCALRKPSKRAVIEALIDEPDATITSLADRLGRANSTVKKHVDDLVERGVVEDRTETKAQGCRLRVTDAAAQAIQVAA